MVVVQIALYAMGVDEHCHKKADAESLTCGWLRSAAFLQQLIWDGKLQGIGQQLKANIRMANAKSRRIVSFHRGSLTVNIAVFNRCSNNSGMWPALIVSCNETVIL